MKDFKQKPLIGLNDLNDNSYSLEQLNRIENGKNAVKSGQFFEVVKKGGKVVGDNHYKNKTGLFSMDDEAKKQSQSNGGKAASSKPEWKEISMKGAIASINSPNHVNNKRLSCPHCGKEGGYTAMKRWHGDNCKHRPI
jgi:hypothetical protein